MANPPTVDEMSRLGGALPAHLPRIETIVDIEDKACPCCKGALQVVSREVV